LDRLKTECSTLTAFARCCVLGARRGGAAAVAGCPSARGEGAPAQACVRSCAILGCLPSVLGAGCETLANNVASFCLPFELQDIAPDGGSARPYFHPYHFKAG